MSLFLESIKFDEGRVWNLKVHEQRVARTLLAVYRVMPKWSLSTVVEQATPPGDGLMKCRVVYDIDKYTLGFEPYTMRPIRTLKLVEAPDIEYSHKYLDRNALNTLYAQRDTRDDILIVKNGRITDTSYANILFEDDRGLWVTPADCLLKGTMRQSLLDSGRIFEKSISVDDLGRFRAFKVVNALRDMSVEESEISNID